ncbi:hypothetical protein JCM21900_006515 [Sporobolomyces salmonicolor]
MPSKPASASSAAPAPDPAPHDLPVAPTDEARAASSSGGKGSAGAAGEPGEGQRAVPTSKDDQQISQILAEMSQQQHSPPMTTRSKGSTASPAVSTPPLAAPTSTFPPPPLPSYPSAYPPSSPRPSAQREPSSIASTAGDGPPLSAYSAADPATSAPASRALPDLSAPASAGPDRQAEEDDDELDGLPSDTKPNRPAKTTAKGKGKGRGRGKSEERQGMNDIEWERSRKDNHKEVERRRRETINAGISSLAALLPPLSPSDDPHAQSPTTAPSKLNKGLILTRAAAYIEALKAAEASNIERWTLEKLLSDQAMGELRGECERLRREGRKWEEEVEALRDRVRVLEEGEPDGRGPVGAIGKRAAEAAGADGGERKRPRPQVDELP